MRDGKIYAVPREIIKADLLRDALPGFDKRTLFGRRMKRALALAERHEAAVAKAIEDSALVEAEDERLHMERYVASIAIAISKAECRTVQGALLKARALVAVGRIGRGYRFSGGGEMGVNLAMSLVAVMAGEVVPAEVHQQILDRTWTPSHA